MSGPNGALLAEKDVMPGETLREAHPTQTVGITGETAGAKIKKSSNEPNYLRIIYKRRNRGHSIGRRGKSIAGKREVSRTGGEEEDHQNGVPTLLSLSRNRECFIAWSNGKTKRVERKKRSRAATRAASEVARNVYEGKRMWRKRGLFGQRGGREVFSINREAAICEGSLLVFFEKRRAGKVAQGA